MKARSPPRLAPRRALDGDGRASNDLAEPGRRLLDAVPVERTPRATAEPPLRPQDFGLSFQREARHSHGAVTNTITPKIVSPIST